MGNCSCDRPVFKKHVRRIYVEYPEGSVGASDSSRFRGLIKYASSCPDKLPNIGGYLLKQIYRDTSVPNTRRIEIAISAFEALLSVITLPLDFYADCVIQAITTMFDNSTSPEFNLHGLKLLLAFVTHQEYKSDHEVKKFYGTLQKLCVKQGLASDEIRLDALSTLKEMMLVDKHDTVIDSLEDFIPVIFDNITCSEFERHGKSASGIGRAARSCFNIICLRTLSNPTVHERDDFEKSRRHSLSMSYSVLIDNDGMVQNFWAYERLMSSLIAFLSKQDWNPLEFCANVFLYFHRVAKWDLMKICRSIAASMKKIPTGSGSRRLDRHDRIILLLYKIFRGQAYGAVVSPSCVHLSAAVREIFKQTLNLIINSTEKGENYPEGKAPSVDRFASHTLTCLEPLFSSLSYTDTLLLLTDLLDDWLKKAWIAESYYGTELILRIAGHVSMQRKRFPKSVSPIRIKKVLVLALRFQSNAKLSLIQPLWKKICLLSSKLLLNILIPPTPPLCSPRGDDVESPAFSVDLRSRAVYVDQTLQLQRRVQIAECFKLPWFEDFRLYLYLCLYNGFRSNNLSHEMASSLHRLLIVVMNSDQQLDISNIIKLLTILQDEVNSEAVVPRTRDLVRCCILATLIQLARGISISGKKRKDAEMVESAKAAEVALMHIAGTWSTQQDNDVKLAVSPVTGLLIIAKERRIDKSTDFTEFSESDNLCEFFGSLIPMPTEDELREWFQHINDVHTKYSKGISDETSAHTHNSYQTRFSRMTPTKSNEAPKELNTIGDDEPSYVRRFDKCETFQEFSEAFTFNHRKSECELQQLMSMELHWDYPSPIQADDLVLEHELADCPKLVNNQMSESPRRHKEIRNLFGNKRRRDVLRNIASQHLAHPSPRLGQTLNKLFDKFGFVELPLEEGLVSFELGNESIDILRSSQLMRELRYMGEYEKTGIERFIQVRKNVQASAKEWFLRIKKNVQEKRQARRNPFVIGEGIRALLQKGEQALMVPGNDFELEDVSSRLINELSEIRKSDPCKDYVSTNFQTNFKFPSSYPTTPGTIKYFEKANSIRTVNSLIPLHMEEEYFYEESDCSSLNYELAF